MRPVRHEDRASLRPRTTDALPLLRRAVLCGIPKDDGAGSREESAMKCSNQNCGHGIGLVSYQRNWFDKRRFCSKKCRDDFTVERPRPSQQERLVGSYFNWLLANATSQVPNKAAGRAIKIRPRQNHPVVRKHAAVPPRRQGSWCDRCCDAAPPS